MNCPCGYVLISVTVIIFPTMGSKETYKYKKRETKNQTMDYILELSRSKTGV